MQRTGMLDRGDGVGLAWVHLAGRGPTIVFLPGFNSDMTGNKATALAEHCAATGQALLRFDYSGHGASGGAFTDGTIGRWTEDALAVIGHVTQGKLLLVGSSMGGWIGLLAALRLKQRVAGFVGLAAAADFTERLMWQAMSPAERAALAREGRMEIPSEYGAPTTITMGLIEDGRSHLLLEAPIGVACPVRLLHGQRDPDVPWEQALILAGRLEAEDVRVILVKDGDHRLSRPQDLALLCDVLAGLLRQDGA